MSEMIIPVDGLHVDARGEIVTLPPFTVNGVTVISSTTGAVRGNHYHLNESHLMYVVSGLMVYAEEDEAGHTRTSEVKPGESVVSAPRVAHCTVFPEPTVFVTLSDWDRRGRNYENEVVRIAPMEHRPEVAPYIERISELITRSVDGEGARR